MDAPYNLPEKVNLLVPKLNPWIFKKDISGGVLFERNPYFYEVDTEGKLSITSNQVRLVSNSATDAYVVEDNDVDVTCFSSRENS